MKSTKNISKHTIRYNPPIYDKNDCSTIYGIYYAVNKSEPRIAKAFKKSKFKQDPDLSNFLEVIYEEKIVCVVGRNQLYYLLPYYDCGNLQEYLDIGVRFTEAELAEFIPQIGQQLAELHERNLYHGELSPQHICLTLVGGRIKYNICGFGRFILDKPKKHFEDSKLEPYLDPRIKTDPYKIYDASCDIWSLGIILYRLITGEFPKMDYKSMINTNYEFLNPISEIGFSTKLNYFISRCVANNPKLRLKAKKICIQPFLIPNLDNTKDYEITQESLGKGGYGSVYKTYRKGDHSKVFATKVLKCCKKIESIESDNDYKKEILLLGEMTIYQTVKSSPYIVNLYDYFEYKDQVHLVLEYFNGGDLENYILQQIKIVNEPKSESPEEAKQKKIIQKNLKIEMIVNLREIAYSLAHAILDLHEKQIVHRDIKPKNILVMLDENTKQFCTARLSDFGTCHEKIVAEDKLITGVGAPGYMAPEITKGSYDLSVDTWSYGVTLYYTAFGILPGVMNGNLFKDGKVKYPEPCPFKITELYKNLIEKCIVIEPEKRLTMAEVLNHDFFHTNFVPKLSTMPNIYKIDTAHPLVTGSSSNVYNVIYTPTGTRLLLKVIEPDSEKVKENIIEDSQKLLLFRGCSTVYRLCQCFTIGNKFNFMLEYTERRTLEDYVKSLKGVPMDTNTLYRFAYSIAKSIYDIHEYEFSIVGEIEPYKFYLCENKTSEGIIEEIKYAGYSSIQDVSEKGTTKTYSKSTEYVYKFGEILYYMIFGTVDGYETCLKTNKSGSLTSKQMKNAFELVKKCISGKYCLAGQILDDVYFHDY